MSGPRILTVDIENAPILGAVWSLWNNDVHLNQIHSDWYLLSWAAKFSDEDKVRSDSLYKHRKLYRQDPENDSLILKSLAPLLEQADVIVGHNSDKFDLPKIRTRMLFHGMRPPVTGQQVDTLKIAKSQFRFSSNKLQYIAQQLGVGEKEDTGGYELWAGCLRGDKDSWEKMLRYNENDVILTEKVYVALRGWAKNTPNYGLYVDNDSPMCPACGSLDIGTKGYRYTSVAKYRRYQCKDCGFRPRGRKNLNENKNLLSSVS